MDVVAMRATPPRPSITPRRSSMTQTGDVRECPMVSTEHLEGVDPESIAFTTAITNKRQHEQATRAATKHKQSVRRRLVDPTTSERDYSAAELEFMLAMDE